VTDPLPVCPDAVKSYLDDLVDAGADAIVLVSLDESGEIDSMVSSWDQSRIPLVLIGAVPSAAIVPQVHYDSRQAAHQAARHLLAKGCQSLAFFTAWPTRVPWVSPRIEGTIDAMRLHGIDAADLSIWGVEKDVADAEQAHADSLRTQIATDYLTRGSNPDGIVASNDDGALAIMRAAVNLGMVPGRDFLLVGFDDVENARENGLTTMRRPAEEMGAEGGRLVMQTLGGVRSASRVCVNSHLVVRDTTRWGLQRDACDASEAAGSL
jgi:LacI family transcriptional regulator